MAEGNCSGCGKHVYLTPLHGDKGGPEMCWKCGGAWHAKHAKQRKAGRIVIKAMKVFFDVGGRFGDIDTLRLVASDCPVTAYYGDTIGTEVGDITSELLNDILQLVHPDKHPPERKDEATRITQELLALRPFVFPAPPPAPAPVQPSRDASLDTDSDTLDDLLQKMHEYPCVECAGTFPYYYCTRCKAEHSKRRRDEREQRNAKQRARYARRKVIREGRTTQAICASCENDFKAKRRDAKYCSAACRQSAHRARVTDNQTLAGESLKSRNS